MPQDLIACWNQRKLKALIPRVVVFVNDTMIRCWRRERSILLSFLLCYVLMVGKYALICAMEIQKNRAWSQVTLECAKMDRPCILRNRPQKSYEDNLLSLLRNYTRQESLTIAKRRQFTYKVQTFLWNSDSTASRGQPIKHSFARVSPATNRRPRVWYTQVK